MWVLLEREPVSQEWRLWNHCGVKWRRGRVTWQGDKVRGRVTWQGDRVRGRVTWQEQLWPRRAGQPSGAMGWRHVHTTGWGDLTASCPGGEGEYTVFKIHKNINAH